MMNNKRIKAENRNISIYGCLNSFKKGIGWDIIGYLVLGLAVLVMVSVAIYTAQTGKFPAFIEQIRNLLK